MFSFSVKKKASLLPLVLLLASCGGGSGGSGGPVSGGSSGSGGSDPLPPSGPALTRVSQNDPQPGSVTQSSDSNDKISVTTYKKSKLDFGITVSNGNKWSEDIRYFPRYNTEGFFDTSDLTESERRTLQNILMNYVASGGNIFTQRGTRSDIDLPETAFTNRYDSWFTNYHNPVITNDGNTLHVWGRMKKGATNTDYLTMGIWTSVLPSFYSSDIISFKDIDSIGAFVDGNDPFSQNNLQSLTGTASYSNPIKVEIYNTSLNNMGDNSARAEAFNRNESINKFDRLYGPLYGNINLTVNFDGSDSLGTIEGRIGDFRATFYSNNWNNDGVIDFDDEFYDGYYPGQLVLDRANIGTSNSGFFNGTVSGNLKGRDYNGKWGGQFYGNDRSDGYPESAAGTMAATSTSGDFTVIAPWIADKD